MKNLKQIRKELKGRDVKIVAQRGLKLNGMTAYKVYGAPTNEHALWLEEEIIRAYYNAEI
jgi:hypothetical protein